MQFSVAVRLLGVHPGRTRYVSAAQIVGIWRSDARTVGRHLRWKIAGTALTRQRAMGWFSWVGHRGRWAWVWLTPAIELLVIETTLQRPALLVVPIDWLLQTSIPMEPWPV